MRLKVRVLLLFLLRTGTPKDKAINKVILLSFKLPWIKAHQTPVAFGFPWSCLFDDGVEGVGSKPSFYRTIVL